MSVIVVTLNRIERQLIVEAVREYMANVDIEDLDGNMLILFKESAQTLINKIKEIEQ